MRAWRLFLRDVRQGRLTLLLAAVVLAVGVVSSVALLTERVRGTMEQEAGSLLAADMSVSGAQPVPPAWRQEANNLGLAQADVVSFSSMLFSTGGAQLGDVRAVSSGFPLRGSLEVAAVPFGLPESVARGPEPGEVWLASRLFPLLDIAVGDRIEIGEASFEVSRALIGYPGSGLGVFDLEPRVYMHRSDLESTGVVQPGSRIRYRWLLSGPDNSLASLHDQLRQGSPPTFRWQSAVNVVRSVSNAFDRAEKFLLLGGALTVILSGVALAMAAQRYVRQQADTVALLKTLGMTQSRISRHYGIGLVMSGAVAVAVGLLVGLGVHHLLVRTLSDLLPDTLAGAGFEPYLLGAGTGLVIFMGFAWRPFLRLRRVPPARVLRAGTVPTGGVGDWMWGSGAVFLLVWLYTRDVGLTVILMLGVVLLAVTAGLLAWLLAHFLRGLSDRAGRSWRIGLASFFRHRRQNLFQVSAFGITFMLLFIVSLVRTSLLEDWQQQIPEKAPNHFIFNVFSDELPVLNRWLDAHAESVSEAYPIVRGRLLRVNDDPLSRLTENLPERRTYTRELNLTWAADFGADNDIVDGTGWDAFGEGELAVSVEEEFAGGLGIQVGDSLTFDLGGSNVSANVASLRSLDWNSFNPNFYMIFNQPVGAAESAFHLVSFWLAPENKPALTDLLRALPTVVLIEVDQVMEQIQRIIEQATVAVEFILGTVLLAGFLVLLASIRSTLDSRQREGSVMRTLGASRQILRRALWIEFGVMGLLAGVIGVVGAEVTVMILQQQVFDMPAGIHPALWFGGPLVSVLLVGAIGVAGTRRVVNHPPLTVLRQADE